MRIRSAFVDLAGIPLVVLVTLTACSSLKASNGDAVAGEDDAATGDDGGAPPEAGPDATSGADATPGVDASTPRLVFVTTAQVDGAFGAAGDPLAAADAICKTEATANNLTGAFVAWLSYIDGNGTAFNASTRVADGVFELPGDASDGGAPLRVADSKAELLTTGPRVEMNRTAAGAPADQDENSRVTWVWTGTNGKGLAQLETCRRWTSAVTTDTGVTGNARRIPQYTGSDWTALGNRGCNEKRRFYCFQKP